MALELKGTQVYLDSDCCLEVDGTTKGLQVQIKANRGLSRHADGLVGSCYRTFTCVANAVAVGDVVYVSTTNTVAKADANDSAKVPPVGIVVEYTADETTCVVGLPGAQVAVGYMPAAGSIWWLHTTAGGVTNVKPSTDAYAVAVALSTSTILVLCVPVDVSSGASGWVGKTFISDEVFSGVGLDDLESGGTYAASAIREYVVEIDGTGAPDTFKWSNDGGDTWEATAVAITGSAQALEDGVAVTFGATTGHTAADGWSFTAAPSTELSGDRWTLPYGDAVEDFGASDRRWKKGWFAENFVGDQHFIDKRFDAHWTFIERHRYMIAINQKTGEWFQLGMKKIVPEHYGGSRIRWYASRLGDRAARFWRRHVAL